MTTVKGGFGREHVVSGAFVFLLLGLFAVFATAMVLLSAQLYRTTVSDAETHNAHRVAENYLMNQVRRNDVSGGIRVEDEMLVFVWGDGEEDFLTRIYCHDGALREVFLSEQDEFVPEYGEFICEMRSFAPTLEDGMLRMNLTHADGSAVTLCAAIRCGEVAP